jgi:hypothetical protein
MVVEKCVDIIVDTSIITPYWMANWSLATTNANGESGYVIILPNFKYDKKKVTTKLGLPLRNIGIPVNNLQPQRIMYEQHIHVGRESIAAVEVWVIIIGPDINGDQILSEPHGQQLQRRGRCLHQCLAQQAAIPRLSITMSNLNYM